MKKLLSILLTLCLMMSLVSAFASSETLVYESSFAAGEDDWYARGAQRVYHTTEATLRVEGRTADWNGMTRYFELIPDNEYTVSFEIYQDQVADARIVMSAQYNDDAGESYENLVYGNAKKGEWTTVAGAFSVSDHDIYQLYIETSGFPELSYEIRNFRLESPNGIPEAAVTEVPTVSPDATPVPEVIPSLKEAYAPYFDFGCAAPANAFMNLDLTTLMVKQFSILTPENELKPDSVLDVTKSRELAKEDETAVAIKLSGAKALLSFAQKNGLKVHGHVLIWHSQTPEAFFHEGYDTSKPYVSREVMLARMENYIREVLTQTEEQYPGVIVSWDVVNEAIDDQSNNLRRTSNWYKVVGDDFVIRAFEYARKYAAEGVLLYYNDYNTAYPGKLKGIVNHILNPLIEEGTIDGYGFQMHHSTKQPSNSQIQTAVETIAALGLKLRVSELDVGMPSNNDANRKEQAEKYKFCMELMLRFADQTEAVQVWGISDTMSWRSSSYPLLFDKFLDPKPAFWAVIEAAETFGADE